MIFFGTSTSSFNKAKSLTITVGTPLRWSSILTLSGSGTSANGGGPALSGSGTSANGGDTHLCVLPDGILPVLAMQE